MEWVQTEKEVAEMIRGEWSQLTLLDRLRGSSGKTVNLMIVGGHILKLTIAAVGPSWIGGNDAAGSVVIPEKSVVIVEGKLGRAIKLDQRKTGAGATMEAFYRLLSRSREYVCVYGTTGSILAEGTIDRVACDHCVVAVHSRDEQRRNHNVRGYLMVPFWSVGMVRSF